ncbi:Dedicator of cytokinesis protein 3 [Triplophysa tibetana]|uniref:Dedicator of cytokinesis protein 3 n=1 Tax=Triplophysa tibetana TaxID=1572043 RepID=A0A5A9NSI2_9TELE|nr:Dedicator of cytokinesis protein 3 [Triplophysa tibetana]
MKGAGDCSRYSMSVINSPIRPPYVSLRVDTGGSVIHHTPTQKESLVKHKVDLFYKLRHVMNELIDLRRQLLSGHLTQDQVREVKRHITVRLDWGNEHLALDLVPRKEFEMVDADQISVSDLYKMHLSSRHSVQQSTSQVYLSFLAAFELSEVFRAFNMLTHADLRDGGRQRHGDSCRMPVPHHLFVNLKSFTYNTIGEDTDIFFSLYDLREGKQIRSRSYFYRPIPIICRYISASLLDLSNKDMKRDLYIVSQVIRTGRMLLNDSKKGPPHVQYRRPYGCAVLAMSDILQTISELKEEKDFVLKVYTNTRRQRSPHVLKKCCVSQKTEYSKYSGIRVYILVDGDTWSNLLAISITDFHYLCAQPCAAFIIKEPVKETWHAAFLVHSACNNENEWYQIHENIIRKSSTKYTAPSTNYGLIISLQLLRGDMEQVRRENPMIFNRGVAVTRKLGFPDVIMPVDVRNDLYLILERGDFERGGKSVQKNIEVTMYVLYADGEFLKECISLGSGEHNISEYRSFVLYHNNSPRWSEVIKLPIPIDRFRGSHLRFEFRHCSTKDKGEKKLFGFAFTPLMREDGTTLSDESHELYVYKFLQDILDTLFSILDDNTDKYGPLVFQSLVFVINLLRDSKFYHFRPVMDTYIQKHFAGALAYKELIRCLKWYMDRSAEVVRQDHIQEAMRALEYLFKFIVQSRILYSRATCGMEEDQFRASIQELFQSIRFVLSLDSRSSETLIFTQGPQPPTGPATANQGSCVQPLSCNAPRPSPLSAALLNSFPAIFDELLQMFTVQEVAEFVRGTLGSMPSTVHIGQSMDVVKLQSIARTVDSRLFSFPESRRILLPVVLHHIHLHLRQQKELLICSGILSSIFSIIKSSSLESSVQEEVEMMVESLLDVLLQTLLAIMSKSQSQEAGEYVSCLLSLLRQMSDIHFQHLLDNFQSKEELKEFLLKIFCVFRNLMKLSIFPRDWNVMRLLTSNIIVSTTQYLSPALHKSFTDADFDFKLLYEFDPLFKIEIATVPKPTPEFCTGPNPALSEPAPELRPCPSSILPKPSSEPFPDSAWEAFPGSSSDASPDSSAVAIVVLALACAWATATSRDFSQVWNSYFSLAVLFINQPSLQLETLTPAKRKKVFDKYGDMRVMMAYELFSMWQNLGENKIHFIPGMIGPFLGVTLVPQNEVRNIMIPIFHDMMDWEQRKNGNFKQVEAELIDKLDSLVSEGKGDENYRELFSLLLLEKIEQETWRETGVSFVTSVTRLMERLLDYRDCMKGDETENKKIGCTVNLLNFYKSEINKEEMYIRYIHKLCDMHLQAENYTEAAFTLLLYWELLHWEERPLREFLHYPAQSEWHRKEGLCRKVIHYFNKGKCWEYGIPLCRELAFQYESLYDYQSLSWIRKMEAAYYDNIMEQQRLEPEFFRVGFYGRKFPFFLRNKEFVCRGHDYERLEAFQQRMLGEFPQAIAMQHPNQPDESILQGDAQCIPLCNKNFIWLWGLWRNKGGPTDLQIYAVTPVSENVDVLQMERVPDRIKSFYRVNNVRRFRYDRPFHKGLKDRENEFKSLWIERTTLILTHPLPGISRWFEVEKRELIEVSPLENAIYVVENKNQELRTLISQYQHKQLHGNVNLLSMCLNGVIDAAVNGGIARYQEAFFDKEYISSHPEDTEKITQLKDLMQEQVHVLSVGLAVHEKLVHPEMRPLHKKLIDQFQMMRSSLCHGLPGLDKLSPACSGASTPRGILATHSPMSPESMKLMHRHSETGNLLILTDGMMEHPEDLYRMQMINSGHTSIRVGSPSLPDRYRHNREMLMLLPPHRDRPSSALYPNLTENGQPTNHQRALYHQVIGPCKPCSDPNLSVADKGMTGVDCTKQLEFGQWHQGHSPVPLCSCGECDGTARTPPHPPSRPQSGLDGSNSTLSGSASSGVSSLSESNFGQTSSEPPARADTMDSMPSSQAWTTDTDEAEGPYLPVRYSVSEPEVLDPLKPAPCRSHSAPLGVIPGVPPDSHHHMLLHHHHPHAIHITHPHYHHHDPAPALPPKPYLREGCIPEEDLRPVPRPMPRKISQPLLTNKEEQAKVSWEHGISEE